MKSALRPYSFAAVLTLLWVTMLYGQDDILENVTRTITKEPGYASIPKYLLLVLGEKADSQVWIIEDGEKLYVDKNGNGDLTDDGPALTPSDRRQLGDTGWDFDYVLDELVLSNGSRHTDFSLARWNYGEKEDGYGLRLTLHGETPMYAGWTPFWAGSPAKASIIHFGGALTPKMLRYRDFEIGSETRRLSVAFVNPGVGEGAAARLSIDALPKTVIPELQIEWPVAERNAPLHTSHRLDQRCCYWEFYTTDFQVPKSVQSGNATVTVSLPFAVLPLPLKTERIEVPVVASDQ